MINTRIQKGPFTLQEKWFSTEVRKADALSFVSYIQCNCNGSIPGFKRVPFFTALIDLSMDRGEILSRCGKNTRYKIRRAERDNVKIEIEHDKNRFIAFYNSFCRDKKLQRLKLTSLERFGMKLCITKAMYNDKSLAMHAYLVDQNISRSRLLYAATLFRQEKNSVKRNFIGMANRFLFYKDMVFFKDSGIRQFDFGGYAKNTDDRDLSGINEFKEGFYGVVIEESNYLSYPLYFYALLRKKQNSLCT